MSRSSTSLLLPTYDPSMIVMPGRGVIIVEYYWQGPLKSAPASIISTRGHAGHKASCVFYAPWKVSGPCWCGGSRTFGKCHRRSDDWTYISYNPDLSAHSPVTLLDWTADCTDTSFAQARLASDPRLLPIEQLAGRSAWALAFDPPVSNGGGELILGTITCTTGQLHIETNSDARLEYIKAHLYALINGSIGSGQVRRVEPQKAFPSPVPHKRARSKS